MKKRQKESSSIFKNIESPHFQIHFHFIVHSLTSSLSTYRDITAQLWLEPTEFCAKTSGLIGYLDY